MERMEFLTPFVCAHTISMWNKLLFNHKCCWRVEVELVQTGFTPDDYSIHWIEQTRFGQVSNLKSMLGLSLAHNPLRYAPYKDLKSKPASILLPGHSFEGYDSHVLTKYLYCLYLTPMAHLRLIGGPSIDTQHAEGCCLAYFLEHLVHLCVCLYTCACVPKSRIAQQDWGTQQRTSLHSCR